MFRTNRPVAPYLGLKVDPSAVNSVTRGLVGDTNFAVLPDIPPRVTFVLTLLFQIVRDRLHFDTQKLMISRYA